MNTTIAYWDNLYPHFAPEEFFSPEGLTLFNKNIIPCDLSILHELEDLRARLNRANILDDEITITINKGSHRLRGYVTPREFLEDRPKEEGQIFSYHLWCAADISSNVPLDVVFSFAHVCKFKGIIKYPWGFHLDMRPGPSYIQQWEE